jgi:hypothetical protein
MYEQKFEGVGEISQVLMEKRVPEGGNFKKAKVVRVGCDVGEWEMRSEMGAGDWARPLRTL